MNVEAIKSALHFIQSELDKVGHDEKPKKSIKKAERIGKYQLMFHSKTLKNE